MIGTRKLALTPAVYRLKARQLLCNQVIIRASAQSPQFNTTIHSSCYPSASILRRGFSAESTKNEKTNKNAILLYQRNGQEADFHPKLALTATYITSLYWTWYAIDFLPAISRVADVNPYWGIGACVLGYGTMGVAAAYARSMVSKVELDDQTNTIRVYQHTLPFMQPSKEHSEYPHGEARLDLNSEEVKTLIRNMETGSTTLKGHLPLQLQDRSRPLSVYMTSMADIKDLDLFQKSLIVLPFAKNSAKRKKSASSATTKSEEKLIRQPRKRKNRR